MTDPVKTINDAVTASKFQNFLNNLGAFDFEQLPINHISSVGMLPDFVSLRTIKRDYLAVECEVFNRHLIYCFYGKPAFRLKDKHFYPVCFVFDQFLSEPFKLFPFDSGAYYLGYMEKYFDSKEVKLEDFEVKPTHAEVNKIVGHFFGSNSRYYGSSSKKGLSGADAVIDGYIKMLNQAPSETLDDRKNSIEVIFDKDFDLNSDNLKMIVVPKSDFVINGAEVEFDDFKVSTEQSFSCRVEGYEMTRPQDSYLEIDKVVKQYCKNLL